MNEKQKIIEILDAYQHAANNADARSAADLYAEDAIMIPANFPTNIGKETIFGFYDYAFSLLQLTLSFDIDENQVLIDGNTAYATTNSTGTRIYRESKEEVPEINRELWIFKKIEGDWKIIRYMFNVPPAE
jgi:uncharacterized protein (TIGR02246 family)